MLKVPNNKTIFSLALRQLKSSWVKNLFSVLAIILTSMLIMTVFTIGNTMIEAGKAAKLKNNALKSEVSFHYLLKSEADAISSNEFVEECGASRIVAVVNNGPWNNEPLEIRTANEEYADMTYTSPKEGRLPESKNEIAVSEWMLQKLDIPCESGQTFPLSFDVDNKHYEFELIVSGIINENKKLSKYSAVYISDELADEVLQNVNVEENIANGTYIGSYQLNANLDCKDGDLKSVLDKIVADTNTDAIRSVPRVNIESRETNAEKGTVVAEICILAIVMISGFFLIYNIFFISIEKNIRSYGMLKTIGTTSTQIKHIVNIQGIIYCAIGIPCGLTAGYLLSAKLFPFVVSISNVVDDIKIVVEPLYVAAAALLSMITVFISCRQPAKYASKITPIESVRYSGTTKIYHPKKFIGTKKSGILQMSYANLFRNKKKMIITIVSVTLGMILVNIFYTFSQSFNVDNMTNTYIYSEITVADKEYLDFSSSYTDHAYTLHSKDVEEISHFDGVKAASPVYFRCDENTYINSGSRTYSMLYGIDDFWYSLIEDNMINGSFDRQKFDSGKYILIAYDSGADVGIGDIVTVNNGKNYEVMGKVSYEKLFSISARYNVSIGFSAYLPYSELRDMNDTDIMSLSLSVDDDSIDRLKDDLDTYVSMNNNSLDYTVRSEYKNEIKKNNTQFSVVSIMLSFIILLIGMLNFMNTSISEIISRKYETAILNAIGMTSKQIRLMQILESLIFSLIVSIFYVPISTLLSYLIIGVILRDSDAFSYHFSVVPIAATMLLLLILSVLIPLAVSKFSVKNSTVERLRG